MRAAACAFLTFLAASAAGTVTSAAYADGLTPAEHANLARGETVVRKQDLTRGDRRYVGGLTYTVLDASAAEVARVFEDVGSYQRVLPRTKAARVVGASGTDKLVELTQGNALFEAEYTILLRHDDGEWRFWLEPSLPHGIDDAWGFFRLQPFAKPSGGERVLLTYGILVDVGAGIVRDLFEERIRTSLLSVPQNVRRYVAELSAAR